MMQQITDYCIDRVEIPEVRFYDLPRKAQELVRAYAKPLKSPSPGVFAFEIAAYRWKEINAAISENTLVEGEAGGK